MSFKLLFNILQVALPFLIKRGVDASSESIRERGQMAYVEGVRIARYAVICLLICICAFVVLIAALVALIYGIIVLASMERDTLAWVAIGGGSFIIVAFIVTICALLSERRWIKIFHLDKLPNR
ncbi:MAG: hypothetical protein J0L93_02860 [Deltaproteobacteria bacterium]|nr:hypothetical protein [Deltaproteobacteria bacterium]